MDILYLVDRLENLVASSRRMPLVNQVIVKESDLLNIVDQMRSAIPEEIKRARRIIQEKERILAQAQSDAKNIHARAREEVERLLQREGLLLAAEERSQEMMRLATEQAQLIVQRAEEQTERLKIEADSYATETLRNLREHLLSIEMDIGRNVLSIEKGLESLEDHPQPSEEVEGNEGYANAPTPHSVPSPDYSRPPGVQHSGPSNQPGPGPAGGLPPQPPGHPRRSSLAADTMGAGPLYP